MKLKIKTKIWGRIRGRLHRLRVKLKIPKLKLSKLTLGLGLRKKVKAMVTKAVKQRVIRSITGSVRKNRTMMRIKLYLTLVLKIIALYLAICVAKKVLLSFALGRWLFEFVWPRSVSAVVRWWWCRVRCWGSTGSAVLRGVRAMNCTWRCLDRGWTMFDLF